MTVDLALEFIEKAAGKEEPFVAFIWTGAPHLPHEARPELQALYPDQPDNLKNYYGEISGIDRAVGHLRRQLRELNIAGETLLWFASDNGGRLPEANNGELRDEKGTLWEGGIRVPSILEWPGHIEPRVSRVPSAMVDLFPTFLELAGVDPNVEVTPRDGISLVPLINSETSRREAPIGFWNYGGVDGQIMRSDEIVQDLQRLQKANLPGEELNEGRVNPPDSSYEGIDQYPDAAAWIEGDWKLHARNDTARALYNLADDPEEANNLLKQDSERVERMHQALREWQHSVINSIRGEDY